MLYVPKFLLNTVTLQGGRAGLLFASVAGISLLAGCGKFNNPNSLAVLGVDPPYGAMTGGTFIKVQGTGFVPQMKVKVGGGECLSVEVASKTELTCTTPPGNVGTAEVKLSNPKGQDSSKKNGFDYLPPPTFSSVYPPGSDLAGGQTITITGTGYYAGVTVTTNGVACTVTVISPTSIQCVTGASGPGSGPIVITNADGQSVTTGNIFTFAPAPVISSIAAPNTFGPLAGGTVITINGSNFVSGATVTVGGAACAPVVFISSNQLSCTTPPGAAGTATIVVTNPDTVIGVFPNAFLYQGPPTVVSITPTQGIATGAVPTTVTGTLFQPGVVIRINGTPCAVSNYVSSTSATCSTPALPPGGPYAVSATNTDAQGTSTPSLYTALAPANFSISDPVTFTYPTTIIGSSASHTFTVTNGGQVNGILGPVTTGGLGLAAPYALTGGTCATGAVLIPTGSCTLIVDYTPSVTAVANDSIDLLYNDGATGQTANRPVTGSGLAAALLTLAPASTYNYGLIAIGAGPTQTFTVSNSGGVNATLGTVSDAGLGLAAPYAYVSGTCATGGVIAPAGSCTITVRYVPTASVTSPDSIDLTYNNGVSAQTASSAITGTGANPAVLTVSDPGFDYGTVVIGNAPTKTFTVSNAAGTVNAVLSTISTAGLNLAAPYALTGGTCSTGASLPASGSCTLIVTYTPTAAVTSPDTLDVFFNDGIGTQTAPRPVTGTGQTPASLTVSDPGYSYGTVIVGLNASKTFTVSNAAGGASATLGTVSTAGLGLAGGYSLTGGTCSTGAVIAASGTCTLVVQFAPAGAGVANDSVDLSYNNGTSAQTANRAITGTGQSAAVLTISDPAYNYGGIILGNSASKTFTVSNAAGGASATLGTVSAPALGLAAPYSLTGGTCATGGVIAAAGSCTLIIQFTPTATGAANDSIDLAYNDGVGAQTASRAITGSGANPAVLTISDVGYTYGTVVIGNAPTKTFTVSNAAGGASATLGTISAAGLGLSVPYSLSGGTCSTGAVIAASGTCTIIVQYAPSAAVVSNDSIDLGYNDGVGAQTANRAITGTGQAAAVLTISDVGYSYGTVIVGTSGSKVFTVSNAAGGASATLGTVSTAGLGLAAPYSMTGGTCSTGAVIAASGTCTITVQFAPTGAGAVGDTIALNYNNGASAQISNRAITGTGQSAAVLTISDPGYDYGTVPTGSNNPKVFTVSNAAGGASATLGTISAAGLGLSAPYSVSAATCATGGVIAAGGSCTITVNFAPTIAGAQSDTIALNYNNGASAQVANRAITGTGNAAPAQLAFVTGGASPTPPNPDSYGTTQTFANHTYTVRNIGGATTSAITVSLVGADGIMWTPSGTCSGNSLAPGATCTIGLFFNPKQTGMTSGAHSATLQAQAATGGTATNTLNVTLAFTWSTTYSYGFQPSNFDPGPAPSPGGTPCPAFFQDYPSPTREAPVTGGLTQGFYVHNVSDMSCGANWAFNMPFGGLVREQAGTDVWTTNGWASFVVCRPPGTPDYWGDIWSGNTIGGVDTNAWILSQYRCGDL